LMRRAMAGGPERSAAEASLMHGAKLDAGGAGVEPAEGP
jgi:hypothetical protein